MAAAAAVAVVVVVVGGGGGVVGGVAISTLIAVLFFPGQYREQLLSTLLRSRAMAAKVGAEVEVAGAMSIRFMSVPPPRTEEPDRL
jgi:hypothetical protein